MRGALYPGKTYIALMSYAQGTREKSVQGGKASYPGSVVSEFHCTMNSSYYRKIFLKLMSDVHHSSSILIVAVGIIFLN